MKIYIPVVALFFGLSMSANAEQTVGAKNILQGWQCMGLAASYGPDGINAAPPPVYAGPEATSPKVGMSGGSIIVPDPIRSTNGRTEMIWSNGRHVWIDTDQLTKWHSLADPSAVCQPERLENGRYGFYTHH